MTRRIVRPEPPATPKDAQGAYLPPETPSSPVVPSEAHTPSASDTNLDELLGRQLLALDRVTRQLALKASAGSMTNQEIAALAVCIKITMELRAKEAELLDNLPDEELERSFHGHPPDKKPS